MFSMSELTLLGMVVAPFVLLGAVAYLLLRLSSPKTAPAESKPAA